MPDFGFAFISTDEFGRPKAAHRQLIRSHCVKGKNRRSGSYRSARYAREDAVATAVATTRRSRATYVTSKVPSLTAATKNIPWYDMIADDMIGTRSETQSKSDQHTIRVLSPSPPLMGCLAFMRFADDLDHQSLELVSEGVAFSALRHSLYPIELCLDFGGSTGLNRGFAWMAEDAAYLHSAILTISALRDYNCQRQPSRLTVSHLRKTLSLLNLKLATNNAYLLDSIIFIIMTLHMMASMFDDRAAALTHMRGLEQVVRLRGGMNKLDLKLRFKIACLDATQSHSTGNSLSSHFNDARESWDPVFRGIYPVSSYYGTNALSVDDLVDEKLSGIFRDLQHLATIINKSFDRNTRVSGNMVQSAIGSMHSRLLQPDYGIQLAVRSGPEEAMSECLRLGMLAFITTMIFQLPGRRYSYPQVAESLRDACEKAVGSVSTLEERVVLAWVMTIGALFVFDASAEWLRRQWEVVWSSRSYVTWEDVRLELGRVMWIGCIHDMPGKKAFEVLSFPPL